MDTLFLFINDWLICAEKYDRDKSAWYIEVRNTFFFKYLKFLEQLLSTTVHKITWKNVCNFYTVVFLYFNNDFFSEIADYITKPLYDVEENVGGKSDIIRYEVKCWDVPDIRYPVGY